MQWEIEEDDQNMLLLGYVIKLEKMLSIIVFELKIPLVGWFM